MKIITRQELMKLKTPFIFSNYTTGSLEGLYQCFEIMKSDFCVVNLLNEIIPKLNFEDAETMQKYRKKMEHWSSGDRMDLAYEMEKGIEFELDLECGGREGLFDDNMKYALYDKSDLLKLINKLQEIYIRKYDV